MGLAQQNAKVSHEADEEIPFNLFCGMRIRM
jgi:hypothetical protein